MAQKREKEVLETIEKKIALFPDFPKKGILFRPHRLNLAVQNRDIMPIFCEPVLCDSLIQVLCDRVSSLEFDQILAVESRGFLIGPLLAQKLNPKRPFVPVRKRGKLPGQCYSISYELEYGQDCLEVQKDGLPKGSKCLIIDDLIATGGSLQAAIKLVELNGSQVTACAVLIELQALKGKEKLGSTPMITLFSY